MSLSNQRIAEHLVQVATLLRLAGENEFKAIAFDKAARTIESLESPLRTIDSEALTTIPGIGKSIAGEIESLLRTGEMPALASLLQTIPPGLMEWLEVSGLGPKNCAKIHKALQITELSELKEACIDGRVAQLPGLGTKSAEKILKSIEWMEQFSLRCRLDEADAIARSITLAMQDWPQLRQLTVAGSLRRGMETIGDIDVLAEADRKDASSLFDAFTSLPIVKEVLGKGDTKCSVRVEHGRQVDLRLVDASAFPAALLYFTGSKEHNVFLRGRARERGMALNEYGLFYLEEHGETDFNRPIPVRSEAEIYQHLGLQFIPPELREDTGELLRFETYTADDLLEVHQIRGVLHAHSTWSDGSASIHAMAEACRARGYAYLGITDHSQTAFYAGGLSPERVFEQWKEIDQINNEYARQGISFVVLKGIESDILPDGSLDYTKEVLAGFDFVIASIHAAMEQSEEKMTARMLKAIDNKYTRLVGHPTTRLLLKREGSQVDMNKLIEAAAASHTAIEINASPWRLDLDWRWGRKARAVQLLSAICPDAHSLEGIDDIAFGVTTARKAGFTSRHILNTLEAADICAWCRNKK